MNPASHKHQVMCGMQTVTQSTFRPIPWSLVGHWILNSSKTLFRTGFAGTAMLRPLPFYGPIIENLLEIQIFWYIVLWSLFISYISTTIGSPGCQKRSQFLQRHFHYEYPVKKVVTAHLFWLVDWHLIFKICNRWKLTLGDEYSTPVSFEPIFSWTDLSWTDLSNDGTENKLAIPEHTHNIRGGMQVLWTGSFHKEMCSSQISKCAQSNYYFVFCECFAHLSFAQLCLSRNPQSWTLVGGKLSGLGIILDTSKL